jgi:hypothetical protein
VSGRYNFINLIYIRKEKSLSYIYCKKGRHPYIFIDFSEISQKFRKLIFAEEL